MIKGKTNFTRLILSAALLFTAGCSSSSTAASSATALYKAGTYTGTGKGNNGDITVEVTLSDSAITEVKVTEHGETQGICEPAMETVPQEVVDEQTWDVDTVSGCTNSSKGIRNAVKAALESAGVDVEAMAKATAEPEAADVTTAGGCAVEIDDVNSWLNSSADLGEGSAGNAVAVIPFNHVNGPRDEHNFYAFVDFKYKARKYIKYQVTYLSCTCRSADVNYWQTAYVELTLPSSKKIEDSEVRFLSFDEDSAGHYLGGFWGDSNPTPAGVTYETFKAEYIPYWTDKPYSYIKTLSFMDDIDPKDYTSGDGRENLSLDTFTGSSVSTNNIIRMLNALFEYHGTDSYFTNASAAGEAESAAQDLPEPVDTSKTYKPSEDADETACTVGVYNPSCSSINADNLAEYLGRDDVYYIDLRNYSDYAKKHLRNFENIPYFAMIFDPDAGTDGKPQLYGGTPEEPVATYEESDELLEAMFPRDHVIFLMCQSGGRVNNMMKLLAAKGYDMSLIYNIGGMGQYTSDALVEWTTDNAEIAAADTYTFEGLTANKAAKAETVDTIPTSGQAPSMTITDPLPEPRDTTKTYKPSEDAEETACAADVYNPSCSSINADNLAEYLGRDDIYYIDLRDQADYIKKHLRNFEHIPYFALIFDPDAGTEGKPQLYGGTPEEPVATYEESDDLLEAMFPRDHVIFLMCQSGGRVNNMMKLLAAKGYDMSKIYNISGMGQFTNDDLAEWTTDLSETVADVTYGYEGLTPVK
ncbi:MAG: FMN-binding protein [Bulleidia sp.]|nr:FMN-binding protein [Bulleidia sp.]